MDYCGAAQHRHIRSVHWEHAIRGLRKRACSESSLYLKVVLAFQRLRMIENSRNAGVGGLDVTSVPVVIHPMTPSFHPGLPDVPRVR